ncbi:MAG: class I tRNA ligase family protein [Bacteroidetes bacterium]|nr:class I tRNA ligase family protein [Bacteroidota bacterium]
MISVLVSEMVKPEFVDGQSLPIDKSTYEATIGFFEQLLKVVHPWMPFISEELWSLLGERKEKIASSLLPGLHPVKWMRACWADLKLQVK